MNTLNALGYFMDYCNRNEGLDPYVDQERFRKGCSTILSTKDETFSSCRNAEDVMVAINWPNI